MDWIFLSPHFDDAVFSCGGLIWDNVNAGQTVQVWTICAGDFPPGELSRFAEELHQRWGMGDAVIAARRAEDDLACARLGAAAFRLPLPDCIYRRSEAGFGGPGLPANHLYTSEASIFGEIHPDEAPLVDSLGEKLATLVPKNAELACPLTVGGHVDHRLVRAAAERMGRPLWYYADVPYVLHDLQAACRMAKPEWERVSLPVSGQGLEAWIDGAAAYATQIPTFWQDKAAIGSSIAAYLEQMGGFTLWKAP